MGINIADMVFTWSNNQNNPIFSTIDRVFSSIDWESHFPLSTLVSFSRVGSDHAPSFWILGKLVALLQDLLDLRSAGSGTLILCPSVHKI